MTIESINLEIKALSTEANEISLRPTVTSADRTRFDYCLSRVASLRSQLKTLQTTDEERRARMRDLAVKVGPDALLSKEERGSIRTQLLTPRREERTYVGMSVATDTAGGDFVPVSFYDKLTFALKKTDALFDSDVITVVPSEHGNAMTFAVADDTSAAATVVSENANGTETEIATIDRLAMGKTPTWRSGKLFATLEILQDSAFDVESQIITPAVAKRFQRGCGSANVATLLGSITSGATSATTGNVTVEDCLALLGSVNPEYLDSPKAFFGMNRSTMVSLMRQKNSTGSFIWKPQYDAAGRPMLANIPVVILPSLANVASAAKPVVVGDFSRCIRRQVQSVRVIRYEQAPNFVEAGIIGYQAFLRSDFGVLTSSSSDSPLKYLTVA